MHGMRKARKPQAILHTYPLQVLEGLNAPGAWSASGVVEVGLIVKLGARDLHLVRVDDYHIGAHVHGRRVGGVVLAPECRRRAGGTNQFPQPSIPPGGQALQLPHSPGAH
eukprot:1118204-Pelagomonas_calceolata.AAC.2